MNSFKANFPITQLLLFLFLFSNQINASSKTSFEPNNSMDNVAPIAICDEFTIATIGNDGTGILNAPSLDDGSTDNVGIVLMEARRMDNPACPGFDGTDFGPTVPFYCCDVDLTVMVEFRVSDAAGNTNSCMVEVTVQDKLAPIINCPADITILCTEYPNTSLTGEATASDNCITPVDVTYIDISITENDCGEGEIERAWTATAGSGAYSTSSCIQIITIENPSLFEENDITWPVNYTASTCGAGLEPENLPSPYNEPELDEGNCNNVAVGYNDQILEFGGADACLKILRKWYVVDWCQASGNPDPTQPGPGIWHHTQILKINNSSEPVITNFYGEAVIDNYEENCGSTFAAFEITAEDDCTDPTLLTYTWEFSTGETGSGTSAWGAFTNGNYSLTFTVDDQCGNSVWYIHDFTVKDSKKPTPVCIFGIATVVMPSSGSVTIWASDFEDGSSYDNCTAYDDLKFSFSSDVNLVSMDITCVDICNDPLIPIDLYVTDEEGNSDFCSTFLNVQDPNGSCSCGPAPMVQGTIEDENQELIEEVTVSLIDNNGNMPNILPFVTGVNGEYYFNYYNGNVVDVLPKKDINYLNGVTTYDLVLISKHILGIELLDSPYKVIAADANHSESLTTLDLVKLRALILHIEDELVENDSWRFVHADYVFPNPYNPFEEEFPEIVTYTGQYYDPVNFVAMKVGDVNGTASPNSLLGSDTRTFDGELTIQLQNQNIAKGETFTVDFRAKDFKDIEGYQFSLGFDKEVVEFVDVTPSLEGLNLSNFGLAKLDKGVITTSWNNSKAVSLEDDAILFSMTFEAKTTVDFEKVFSINSRYTEAEAYSNDDLYDIKLEINNNTITNNFALYQNVPNPFSETTMIGFDLPKSEKVTLKIYDVSGRVLKMMKFDGVKGYNSKELRRSDFDFSGTLYYQLKTSTDIITKKMILMD